MFSDCSGPCHTCAAFSGSASCLAGHGDDHYSCVSREEAMVRLGSRRTPGGKPYTQEQLDDLARIARVAAPAALTSPIEVSVPVDDLRIVRDLACEYERLGQQHCDEMAKERGGHCRSCWVRKWAEDVLKDNNFK